MGGGAEGKGEFQAHSMLSSEPNLLDLRTVSQNRVWCLTDWATQLPLIKSLKIINAAPSQKCGKIQSVGIRKDWLKAKNEINGLTNL